MFKLFVLAAVLVTGVVGAAFAGSCNTTCQTYGNQTSCQRYCW